MNTPDLISLAEEYSEQLLGSVVRHLFTDVIKTLDEILEEIHKAYETVNKIAELLHRGISFSIGARVGLHALLLDLSKLTKKMEFRKCFVTNLATLTEKFFSKLT